VGLRILPEELEALLRDSGLFISSGAAIRGRAGVEEVAHNSAEIRGGELFIGLVGKQINGGTFAVDAIDRGAAMCLIDQAAAESLPSEVLESCIVVADTLQAFWHIAQWWVAELDIPLVAITGSVGKTTVKELLAAILVGEGPGLYSQASYNNHVGVPSTLCRANSHHKWGVVEIGMNSPGEIAPLASLFVARVAVITCIAEAHLERLQSREGILREKLDIVRSLKPGGVLIVNGNEDDLYMEAQRVAEGASLTLKSFGLENDSKQVRVPQNEVTIKSVVSLGLDGIEVVLCSGVQGKSAVQWEQTFQLHLPGTHNGFNVAAAVCAALELFPNLNLEGAKRRLTRFRPPVMRMQLVTTNAGVRILSDCFNANPRSMHAFLDVAQDELDRGKTVVLVVGEMRELGEISAKRHREVFDRASGGIGALKVIFVGEEFRTVFMERKNQAGNGGWLDKIEWFSSSDGVFEVLSELVAGTQEGDSLPDMIMVKGSRGLRLEAVIDPLIEVFGGERVEEASQFLSMDG
jgi:UDP-N-acetylmuramoyl-tripeptide--D-alanyl-D-alanine ligase